MGFALSRKEERFLEAAVKAIIRRAAEVAQNPGAVTSRLQRTLHSDLDPEARPDWVR